MVSVGIDYFGGAYKKPNLTMVWNRAESDGLVSYHAGCTSSRILKGSPGPERPPSRGARSGQDDACVGKPFYDEVNKSKSYNSSFGGGQFRQAEGLQCDSPECPVDEVAGDRSDGKRPSSWR